MAIEARIVDFFLRNDDGIDGWVDGMILPMLVVQRLGIDGQRRFLMLSWVILCDVLAK